MIQAQTGERSFTVTTESVQNLPVTGRNFASFATLTPGVVAGFGGGATRADGARTNYLLDGVSSVDTGGNQQGSSQLRRHRRSEGRRDGVSGGVWPHQRASRFPASPRAARTSSAGRCTTSSDGRPGTPTRGRTCATATPKPVAEQRDWGYTIGGPVGKPGGKNKLFFFYSEQFSPRTTGGTHQPVPRADGCSSARATSRRAPTTRARRFNLIRDSSTGLPCIAARHHAAASRTAACSGKIPQNRLYRLGLNILNIYPLPNTRA